MSKRKTARKRQTARVMLFDEAGAILLIRFVVPREGGEFVFWALPGGEIEPGETAAAAAGRELQEELGIVVTVEGPVYQDANMFLHQGEMRDNLDFLFRAQCAHAEPRLTGLTPEEIGIMKEVRWWTAEEIEVSKQRIFPAGLAARMREQNRRTKQDRPLS